MATGPGVYVHIPFCSTRCDYCAFATWTDRAHLIDAYVDACVADIERRVRGGELAGAATVYFGGGTPSLLAAGALTSILDAIPRRADAEVTVECNPDSIDAGKVLAYRDGGVTRISLGVQSTQPHVLAALGRTHDRDNVARAVDAIRAAHVTTFNLDVIAGVAGESAEDFDATLADVLAFDPPHVSVYGLMVEAGTPLERRIIAGELDPPDPDEQADRMLRVDAVLTAAGLDWYEISNWARPGHECRHNLGYWAGSECIGIGAAAHGHTGGRRWWNVPRPERYIERIAAGRSPVAGSEEIDGATASFDRLALALRTRDGVPVGAVDPVATDELAAAGLVERRPTRVVLTARGRLLASEITVRLAPTTAASPGVGAGTRYDGVPIRAPRGSSGPAQPETA